MDIVKEYSNGTITIVWRPAKCAHSGLCAKHLPSVFQPDKKPWVDLNAATPEEIAKQVCLCPSGALSIKQTPQTSIQMEDDGKKGMFVIFENDQRAGEMTFTWAGDSKFIIDHTGVDSSYEGKGYGRILVKAAVDYARNKPAKIIPLCPFAKRQFEKHPEYSDVLLF